MASRIIGDKGVIEYVKAAKYLKEKKFKGIFYLIGDVDPANPSSIKEFQINEWKENKSIIYLKHQKKISNFLRKSTIVVLPSYREGFPKILMEAAACGRPVITTNVPGCKDSVVNKVTGILVPVKNYISLASAIKNLSINKKKIK